MKITFLGTNGWYDTDTGNTVCALIETDEYYILLDAGIGIYKSDRYIKADKPVLLFLSHFHHDHMYGLHILFKFKFKSMTVIGQPGTKDAVNTYLSERFSVPLSRLKFPVTVMDVSEGWHDGPVKFRCLPLKHSAVCFGYRLEIGGKVISYCTDTGYCDNSVELAKGADLLISECSLAPGKTTPEWPHMNPELAAKLANESATKRLVLTHFDAEEYETMKMRNNAEKSARRMFKNTLAAKDGLQISI